MYVNSEHKGKWCKVREWEGGCKRDAPDSLKDPIIQATAIESVAKLMESRKEV